MANVFILGLLIGHPMMLKSKTRWFTLPQKGPFVRPWSVSAWRFRAQMPVRWLTKQVRPLYFTHNTIAIWFVDTNLVGLLLISFGEGPQAIIYFSFDRRLTAHGLNEHPKIFIKKEKERKKPKKKDDHVAYYYIISPVSA
jgi:hypothetical protein